MASQCPPCRCCLPCHSCQHDNDHHHHHHHHHNQKHRHRRRCRRVCHDEDGSAASSSSDTLSTSTATSPPPSPAYLSPHLHPAAAGPKSPRIRPATSELPEAGFPDPAVMGLDKRMLTHPRFRGKVFNVGTARNYSGTRVGATSALKWLRRSHQAECVADHLAAAEHASLLAKKITDGFVSSLDTRGWNIHVDMPTRVHAHVGGRDVEALAYRFVTDLHVFNVNTGWADRSKEWSNVLVQALSHFSYSTSGGQVVLCGLRGRVDDGKREVILTGPTMMSARGSTFGCSDLGWKGIKTFFQGHKCSSICERLSRPDDGRVFFRGERYEHN